MDHGAMRAEHCTREDATVEFIVGNYGTTTFAMAEWYFVTESGPTGLAACGLALAAPHERTCENMTLHLGRG